MSRSTLILIIVVGFLAALSSWLSREEDSETQKDERPLPHIPDYYITGFSAAAYSVNGKPRNQLSADNMTHYADDNTTQLSHPQLTFIADTGEQWQLDAGQGDVDATGDNLLLTGSVNIQRISAAAGLFTLSTTELKVLTREQRASTHTPVTITAPGTRIEASGLDARFAEGRLVLYSVRGRYEP